MQAATYFRIVRRWWWLLVVATLLGGASAYLLSSLITPTYRAAATILVVHQQQPGVVQRNDLEASALIANTFSRLVTIRPVLERAVEESEIPLTVGELRRSLEVRQVERTQLIQVVASASDPERAREIANLVSGVFIASPEAMLTSGSAQVSIVEAAEAPRVPVSPRRTMNAAFGAVLGFVACAGLVALFEYLDNTVKTPQQVLELTGLLTLGRLRRFAATNAPGDQLQVALHPRSGIAEEYRAARTNLRQALLPREEGGFDRQVLLVTSANPGDGKSTAVANIALVFGMAGHRVLAVDADLRKPSLHRIFSVDNSEGLTTLLLSESPSLGRAVQRTLHPGVSLLPAGPIPANPAELLGSPRMRALLRELRGQYDLLLLDTPPALQVTDATVLASMADSLVVVAQAGRTRTQDLRAAVEDLAGSGCAMAGVLFNRVRANARAGEYRYGEYAAGQVPGQPGGARARPFEPVLERSLADDRAPAE